MSIINDALKKVQHNLNTTNSLEKAQSMPESNTPISPQRFNQVPVEKPKEPAQTPPLPDMSQYIPVREKPQPVEPPKITVEEITSQTPRERDKGDTSTPRPRNFLKIFLTLVTFILIVCGIFLTYYLYKIETIPDARRRAAAKRNIVQNIPKQINKVVEAIPIPESIRQMSTPSPAPPAQTAQKEVPHESLTLNGIMSTGNKQVALINNKIYEVGDFIYGKEIIIINPNNVRIKDGDKIRTLKVQ